MGVSHEFESERSPALLLDTCFMSLNIFRRLWIMPSHGDFRPSSETSGRSRGGSWRGGGSIEQLGLEMWLEKCLDFFWLDIPYSDTFIIIKTDSQPIFKALIVFY